MFRPDLLLSFKAQYVQPHTLRALRGHGISSITYYPDTSAFAHGPLLAQSLPEYDCVFYTKRFWDQDVRQRVSLRVPAYVADLDTTLVIHRPSNWRTRQSTVSERCGGDCNSHQV